MKILLITSLCILSFQLAFPQTMIVNKTDGSKATFQLADIENITFEDLNVIADVDGNLYKTVTIGTQVWMAENLKTTKFNDGTPIPDGTDAAVWAALGNTPAYCWQDNNIALKAPYGGLYNWYAVDRASNGNKNPCPLGWHVPSAGDYSALINFLGGENVAGGKLKETGTTHWSIPNGGATNETGFTALPIGGRNYAGNFMFVGTEGQMWSTSSDGGIGFYLARNSANGNGGVRGNGKEIGYSIRCLKD